MKRLFKTAYYNLHWILSVFFLVYVGIAVLAPVLFHENHKRAGWLINSVYHFSCHQRPERSLFLFGKQLTYPIEELREHGYNGVIIGYPFVGDDKIGYKTALCVRDLFMYTTIGITGLLICSNRLKIKFRGWMVMGFIPMSLDGGIQFFSEFMYYTQERWGLDLAKPFYLSNNVTRAVSGTIFGFTFSILLIGELKKVLTEEKQWQKTQKQLS